MYRRFFALAIEDDPNDRFFLQKALERIGVTSETEIVSDGQQALDYLKGVNIYADRIKFPLPTVVFADLKMSQTGDGFAVLDWLKQHPERRFIPLVVLSGSEREEDIGKAYQMGACGYLIKPSDTDELAKLMKIAFAYWKTCAPPWSDL